MLKRENFTEEHIRNLQQSSRRDPVLLERAVYAFGLLEALAYRIEKMPILATRVLICIKRMENIIFLPVIWKKERKKR